MARFDAFRNLGVFFRLHLGVELIRLISEESILQNWMGQMLLTEAPLSIITKPSS